MESPFELRPSLQTVLFFLLQFEHPFGSLGLFFPCPLSSAAAIAVKRSGFLRAAFADSASEVELDATDLGGRAEGRGRGPEVEVGAWVDGGGGEGSEESSGTGKPHNFARFLRACWCCDGSSGGAGLVPAVDVVEDDMS